ncbi:ankyrin repeat domain-containing protein [Mucilaginibacter galii]|uniref:Ankyrin repeat domain-containing protein n=1 Tax=Mucilaginibacter galii TaxID=2005073 RepID=A0A917N463_9SPHI|nr:ankyrin repeat domain-containing protein [Mucilaginibacter galii]GGI51742.1 hypothetical protein GCM10011425_29540 [Mucilaginibacter galii]
MRKLNTIVLFTFFFIIQSCDTKTKQGKQTTKNIPEDQESNTKSSFTNKLKIPMPTHEIVDEFYEAIFANDNTKVREMLETKFPANYEPNNKISPLGAVIGTSDNLYLARLLVEGGANINGKENPPVVCCSEYGRLEILKYLVERNADIKNNEAFNKAGFHQFYECGKFLLLNGANQEKGDIRGKLWFFEQAVTKSDYDVLHALLLTEDELNNNNCDGETALIIAIKQNNIQMVSYLI